MRKKTPKKKAIRVADEMRPEYDFRSGVRGKYTARYAEGTNVVFLDPDVAEAFPDSKSVNEVLGLANTAISGGGVPAGMTIPQLSDALASLNENFVDCDTNRGCLAMPQG